jgi:hypothetical protein
MNPQIDPAGALFGSARSRSAEPLALLVPMLLSYGGYGYENCFRFFPALSV